MIENQENTSKISPKNNEVPEKNLNEHFISTIQMKSIQTVQ